MRSLTTCTVLIFTSLLGACGPLPSSIQVTEKDVLPPVGVPFDDGAVVHGRAITTVVSDHDGSIAKVLRKIGLSVAYAQSSGSTIVTSINADSTQFSINATNLVAGGFNGDTLSLGEFSIAGLNDNKLRVCGSNGRTKCTKAVIRVYTMGSLSGFVNTADSYGVPVYCGTLNPTTAVGLLAAGSVQVQNIAIPANKNKLTIADFPSPTYGVGSDFSNAGSGSYAMTFVVEYVLLP